MPGLDLLNFNLSVVYQFVVFMLSVLVITFWILKPITATLNERKRRLSAATADSGVNRIVEEKESEYASVLQSVRQAGAKVRQDVRDEAVKEQARILDDARRNVTEKLKGGQAELAKATESARAEILRDAPQLARELARKILQRDI